MFVGCGDHFFVTHASTRLNDGFNSSGCSGVKTIAEWDAQESPPTGVKTAAAVSLASWALVIIFGRLIAFTWFAVVVPARVPEPVIARLNKAVMEAVESPQTKRRFAELGFVPQTSSARELAAYIQSENERWGPLIRKMGVQLD